MVRVVADCHLEGLVGQTEVTHSNAYMADIIPDLSRCIIIVKGKRTLKARECHVVLGCIIAAEAHVVPQFCCVDPALEQAFVKPEGDLWLVRVEVVTGDARNRLYVVIIEG